MISDVILDKPKKAANIVFLIFGYILASYIVSPIDLVFEQKIPAVIVAGGVFSVFLFYLKPVELLIKAILAGRNYFRAKNIDGFEAINTENLPMMYHLLNHDIIPPKLLNSFVVADEMAKINGAVFFSISLLLASRLLTLINLYVPFEILVILAALILVIAFWEGRSLIDFKLPILNFYYRLHRIGEPSIELNKAVNNKEWLLAHDLMSFLIDKNPQLRWKVILMIFRRPMEFESVLPLSEGGICPKCLIITRRTDAHYCSKCGSPIVTRCPTCRSGIALEKPEDIPTHCISCGKVLIRSKKNDNTTHHNKRNK